MVMHGRTDSSRNSALVATISMVVGGLVLFASVVIVFDVIIGPRKFTAGDIMSAIRSSWLLFLIPIVLAGPFYFQWPKGERSVD